MTRTGIVLMTYGSPRDLDDVGAYMTRVRGGRAPSAEDLDEFRRRYALIGMSPLIEITRLQAAGLQATLGDEFRVAAGMRFSSPSIEDAVRDLREQGIERVLGLVLSPQYSPILMHGYAQAIESAAGDLPSRTVKTWHLNPAFVDVLASRIRAALATFPDGLRERVPVILTAHSLPQRVVDREPEYVEQLRETAEAVAQAADLAPERHLFVYQSAGHTPEEWLKPDMLDVLPELAAAGHRDVLIAPVQFLADHLETLYDIAIGGREQGVMARAAAESLVAEGARVRLLNRTPGHAEALAAQLAGEVSIGSLDELPRALEEAVLIVDATASRVPIVEVEAVRRAAARRQGRPLLLLDIAVPRDVDPNVRGLPAVQVLDLDDLERECPLDVTARRIEIERAEALAAEEAERIAKWLRLRAVGPAIVELRGYAEDIRVAEIRRSSARLKGLTPEQGAAVEALTAGIVNKLLHGPTVALRDAAARPGGLRRSQSRIVRVLRPDRGRAA